MSHKLLIFGGNGFIGKEILKNFRDFDFVLASARLEKIEKSEKNSVENYEIPGYEAIENIFKKEFFSHVLFLSWPKSPPHNSIEHSLFASYAINLCRIFFEINPLGRIFFVGSIHEAGVNSGIVSDTFANLPAGRNLYGISKRFVWDSLQKICPQNLCWLRLSNVYGPGDHGDKILPTMVQANSAGEDTVLHDSRAFVDYVHVSDVARGIVLALKSNYNGVINIGSGKGCYLKDIEKFLQGMRGHADKIQLTSYVTSRDGAILDIRLAHNLLGYHPYVSMEEGLSSLVESEVQ